MGTQISTANASGNGSATAGTSTSWSHTVTGNGNRVLWVIGGLDGSDAAAANPGCTYDGVSMTRVANLGVSGSDRILTIFQLKEASLPAAGAYTVAPSWTGSLEHAWIAFETYDTDQTTPNDAVSSNETVGNNPQETVSSEVDDLVIGAVVQNSPTGSNPVNDTGTSIILQSNAQIAVRAAYWPGAGSVTADFTSDFEQFRIAAFNVNAAAAGSSMIPRMTLLGVG